MAILSASQQQSYLNLINHASIHEVTRLHLANVIEHSNSIDRINELCTRATKIDIAKFQAITAPVVAAAPAAVVEKTSDTTSDVKVAPESTTPEVQIVPEVQTFKPVDVPIETPNTTPEVQVVPEVTTPDTVDVPTETSNTTPEVQVVLEAATPAKRQPIKFNLGAKKPTKASPSSPVVEAKPVLKFFTCDDNQVQREKAVVVNEGTKKALGEAIAACNTWAGQNQDLYLYNNNTCEKVFDTTKAKSVCYMNIIPQNIAPAGETGVAVYSCDEVEGVDVKQANPFTYIYSSVEGQAQHLRDCAQWLVDGGSTLAVGDAGTCTSFFSADAALAGCVGSL